MKYISFDTDDSRVTIGMSGKQNTAFLLFATVLFGGLLIVDAVKAHGATYYIDPTCSSSGDGTTTTCGPHGPFNTWAKVRWAAGNTYSQKGGTTAYEQITVGASGKPGNVITINSYGTGKANLNGGITIPSSSWKGPDANGVYRTSGFGYDMLEDGVFLRWASSPNCQNGNYHYVWGGSSPNYYKPSNGTPDKHVVERIKRVGIELADNNYITITGLNIVKYVYGIVGSELKKGKSNNYITINNNLFSDMQFGVWFNFNNATSNGIKIEHNSFNYIMSSIELQNQGDCKSNGIYDSVDISYNTITHCSQIRGSNGAYNWSDVNTAGWDDEGIGFQGLSNSNIHHNKITGYCRGVVLFTCAGDSSYNNNFFSNFIKTDKEPLMFNPRTIAPPAKAFYNNNVYYNVLIGGSLGFATGLYLGNVPNPTTSYNKIYNNTILPVTNGLYFPQYSDFYEIKNNIFSGGKNYLVANVGAALPEHIVYDHNLYHSGVAWSSWLVNGKKSLGWSQWKTLGPNFDMHSPVPTKPLFTNAAIGDYTLTSRSPAKWSGVNVQLTTDYADKPVHSPPSIGAYEYGTRFVSEIK